MTMLMERPETTTWPVARVDLVEMTLSEIVTAASAALRGAGQFDEAAVLGACFRAYGTRDPRRVLALVARYVDLQPPEE